MKEKVEVPSGFQNARYNPKQSVNQNFSNLTEKILLNYVE